MHDVWNVRDPLCTFASDISSLSLTTTLRSLGLAGNYSPCSRAWTRLDARVHVQLKVGWGFELIRARSLTTERRKVYSRRGTLEEGCSATQSWVERRGCFQVELQATPLCAALGFDPFLFSPSPGGLPVKGERWWQMVEKRDVSLIIFYAFVFQTKRKNVDCDKKINLYKQNRRRYQTNNWLIR